MLLTVVHKVNHLLCLFAYIFAFHLHSFPISIQYLQNRQNGLMLELNLSYFCFLGRYEFLAFWNKLSTACTGFERNWRLFGTLRLTPTVIFVHLKVRLIIIVWVVGLLLLVLNKKLFTI